MFQEGSCRSHELFRGVPGGLVFVLKGLKGFQKSTCSSQQRLRGLWESLGRFRGSQEVSVSFSFKRRFQGILRSFKEVQGAFQGDLSRILSGLIGV